MSDDLSDRQQQEDEMSALESMFADKDGVFSFREDPMTKELSGMLKIHLPRLETELKVCLMVDASDFKFYRLNYAGPVDLSFHFPADYPSKSEPELNVSAVWLTQYLRGKLMWKINEVCKENAGYPMLFFIMQAVIDETANMQRFCGGILDLREFECDDNDMKPEQRLALIREADEEEEMAEFLGTSYECSVCFEHFLGTDCTRFNPCKHVFCQTCATHYFKTMLNDSSVKLIECMEDGCHSIAAETELRKYLTADEYERYERIILQNALEAMGDVVTCARPSCQVPVIVEPVDPTSTSFYNTVAQCSQCGYSFCLLCRRVNHGVEPCRYNSGNVETIIDELENADDKTRAALYQKYGGEKHINRIVENYKNLKWMEENSKRCPRCGHPIERISGCNKMQCCKCNVNFCWLCTKILGDNPYDHFNGDARNPCADQLFAGTELEIEEEFEDFDFVDSDDEGNNFVAFLDGI